MMKNTVTLLVALISFLANADEPVLLKGSSLAAFRTPQGSWQEVKSVALDAANPKALQIEAGGGILVNSPAAKTVNLMSTVEHGDCELHVEFCIPKGSNSGIYLMGRYEVQIYDSFGKQTVKSSDCGGIYESHLPEPNFQGKPPTVNASKALGEWQSYDITFRAPRFDASGMKTESAKFIKVVHNGQVVHENVEVNYPTRSAAFTDEKTQGPLMIQGDHGPVAIRNLRLKAL